MTLGIGSRVTLNPNSQFKGQDERNGKKHLGIIVEKADLSWDRFDWKVKWDFQSRASSYYSNRDLIEVRSTNAGLYSNLREMEDEDEPCEILTDLLKIKSKRSNS